jgi:hypothetical protein
MAKHREEISMALPITIVSGLPRSGTSMMMKMLEAGGVDLVVDHQRKPDADNPKGYFEHEKVKKLKEDATWLNDQGGKGIKVVSLLLYHLPQVHKYKIIFMERHIQEVLDSQRKMLERSGQEAPAVDDQVLTEKFEAHLIKVRAWLKRQPNVECLFVNYHETILNSELKSSEVNGFLGGNLDIHAMAQVIDGSLYRNRRPDLKK